MRPKGWGKGNYLNGRGLRLKKNLNRNSGRNRPIQPCIYKGPREGVEPTCKRGGGANHSCSLPTLDMDQ